MIQSWNETVFPPDQMAAFNDRLTEPHQLEVVPGEHATAETSGLLGLPTIPGSTCTGGSTSTCAGSAIPRTSRRSS